MSKINACSVLPSGGAERNKFLLFGRGLHMCIKGVPSSTCNIKVVVATAPSISMQALYYL